MGNLSTPHSVQKLQTALHAKAKAEPGYRFYAIYDKISREDILAHAYAQCRSNKGAPGVDRQDFEAVEAYGVERWLGELALALRQETYRPDPIRRVFIPKVNGKLRPLGISTLRDRVCMTAAMLVLEPIFEADLPSELYAYRPGRNAQQAVVEVEELLFRGHPEVVDADLADYFGSIPHAELLKSAARRIVDRRVLHLIRMWLDCPVEETDDRGRKTRTTEARDKRRGIPLGSPISPLLANIYMRRFEPLARRACRIDRTACQSMGGNTERPNIGNPVGSCGILGRKATVEGRCGSSHSPREGSMRWEVARIIVDWFAFALVTTDLYGKDNLERLTGKFRMALIWAKDLLRSMLRYAPFVRYYVWAYMPASSDQAGELAATNQGQQWSATEKRQKLAEQYREMFIGAVWIAGLAMLIGGSPFIVILACAFVSAYAILSGALLILKIRGAEGLLLLTGAALFTFEKFFDWWLLPAAG